MAGTARAVRIRPGRFMFRRIYVNSLRWFFLLLIKDVFIFIFQKSAYVYILLFRLIWFKFFLCSFQLTCGVASGGGGATGASMLGTEVESWREREEGELRRAGSGTEVDMERRPEGWIQIVNICCSFILYLSIVPEFFKSFENPFPSVNVLCFFKKVLSFWISKCGRHSLALFAPIHTDTTQLILRIIVLIWISTRMSSLDHSSPSLDAHEESSIFLWRNYFFR